MTAISGAPMTGQTECGSPAASPHGTAAAAAWPEEVGAAAPWPEEAGAAAAAGLRLPRDLQTFAAVLPVVLKEIRRAEADLAVTEAACLHRLKEGRGWQLLGFSSWGDLLREALDLSRSAADDRVALHRLLKARPVLLEAFLEGRLSACQALALASIVNNKNEEFWLKKCRHLPVRALKAAVRETLKWQQPLDDAAAPAADRLAADDTEPDEVPWRRLSFAAPPEVAIAWEAGLETARRVLGRQSPRYACVEAILAEAAPEAGDEDPRPMGGSAAPEAPEAAGRRMGEAAPRAADPHLLAHRRFFCRVRPPAGLLPCPDPSVTGRPAAVARAWNTLELVRRELARQEHFFPHRAPDRAVEILDTLRSTRAATQPLRVLLARLLRDAWQARAVHFLGFPSLAAFVQHHLKLSPRTTRSLLVEADLLRNFPTLEEAFAAGRIGIGQALLLRRVANRRRLPDHVARAAAITLRQLRREMRLLEMLRDTAPDLAHRFDGPLPLPGLEEALLEQLRARGIDPAGIPELPPLDTPPSADPAENPLLLRRLEILLQALALADCQARAAGLGAAPAGAALREPQRQPAAAPPCPTSTSTDPRQTFGNRSAPSPMKTIRVRAPQPIADHWDAALRLIRRRAGLPNLPAWACVTLLLRQALAQWELQDPDSIPNQHKTLLRDEYRCQAPGCSARRNLEVHHIIFRSSGGRDIPQNRITLCHTHHAWGLHRRTVRLEGQAPHALRWIMPFGVLRGEKYQGR